jgi:hypothetical protein
MGANGVLNGKKVRMNELAKRRSTTKVAALKNAFIFVSSSEVFL